MKAQTRQTFIGVAGVTLVMIMALSQDVNGQVTAAYFAAVLGLVSPEALDRLNGSGGGP
jgi:hypothetical protein